MVASAFAAKAWPRSMRARLTLAFAAFIGLFMAVFSSAIIVYSQQLEATQLAKTLEVQAERFRADVRRGAPLPNDWDTFLSDELRRINGKEVTIVVFDKEQNLIARTQRSDDDWPRNGDWLTETVNTNDYTIFFIVPWHSTGHELQRLRKNLAIITIGVVFATALGSWLLVGRVLSPIDHLSHEAEWASVENLKLSLTAPSNDAEVVGLVGTLNRMLARLAQTVAARERFHSAASHELRTPLQGFGALLEYGLSRPRSSQEWEEIAREAHAQSLRLSQLTIDLLALNQLEMATARPPVAEVDAADLIERVLHSLAPRIAEKRLELQVELPDEGEVMASWNHLETLLRNLLENAVKYALDGGQVRVQWQIHADGSAHFQVWNSTDLPPETDTSKWFEAFFRLDDARESAISGNGLGLAICAATARANGWDLRLQIQDGGLLATLDIAGAKERSEMLSL